MNCSEAEEYVSALYDGESIPSGASTHITQCEECHRTLRAYSQMGAELRLASLNEQAPPLPLRLLARNSWMALLRRRVTIPQFAVGALVACVLIAPLATTMLRAQAAPLWFEFGYSLESGGEPLTYQVAQVGFDEDSASMSLLRGQLVGVAFRVRIEAITNDEVILRARAIPARMEPTATGATLLAPVAKISLDGVPKVHYKPGGSLTIPIEGGGTLYLKGNVRDYQPKIAFGTPLIPAADKMSVRSPVLLGPSRLIGELSGASATAGSPGQAVRLFVPAEGLFTFALQPFPGAVQGEANWGKIQFQYEGKPYSLLAAAPITGGDQPRAVWVRRDAGSDWGSGCNSACLGSGPVPK